ncbi:Conserved hypothetical protein CHP00730 [Gemmatirosa kalamazoonensis]|uniref:Cytokinin riboside 5'-monophosphate phosphoribohydrolase n=1 Tax=Gemmatirosa kalamazoonensis TaxID=861299 RepID=W0RKC1_9BACT|nr:TIGR00730 family Rossman fold protein [Gemmatirosa kalamazoonensis]AHG89883.1 Conserved hypothetical protein CHP00730 [Gemmatirosa kalamazoonensis]
MPTDPSPRRLSAVCVFCGSSSGVDGAYVDAARDLGRLLARRGVALVYGGARVGVMGAIADAALDDGGRVVGVMPRPLWSREVGHTGLTELLVVDTMHERKALMAERSDAFVALPGGAGTLEELFEMWTWAQLGIHTKPVALLNVGGFFDPLLAMVEHLVTQGFVRPAHRAMLVVEEQPDRLLARLAAYEAPATTRWLTTEEA